MPCRALRAAQKERADGVKTISSFWPPPAGIQRSGISDLGLSTHRLLAAAHCDCTSEARTEKRDGQGFGDGHIIRTEL